MDISPHSLHIFMTLAKVKNFTKTASLLGMTQPGVSQHIKQMEEYFGHSLLHRFGRKFELTVEGEKVLNYARTVFKDHQNFLHSLSSDDHTCGLLKMASPGAIGTILYSELLAINKKTPTLSQHFFYAPNRTIEKELLDDEIDLGFMSIKPKSELLQATRFTQEELLLIIPAKHTYRDYRSLVELGFINHPDGRDMLQKLFSSNFKKDYQSFNHLPIAGANNQIGRILEPVAMGLGFTVLPHFVVESFAQKKKIRTIPLENRVFNTIYTVKKRFRNLPARYPFVLEQLSRNISHP